MPSKKRALYRITKNHVKGENIMAKKSYNHYVSVVVEGQLDNWTGSNPEKDPSSIMEALQRAECYRSLGKTSYAVVIKELNEGDYYDKRKMI